MEMSNSFFRFSIEAYDVICRTVSVELVNQCCMAPQNIALTDRALVSQFAGVDRKLFRQKCKAQHALGAATCLRFQGQQFGAHTGLHRVVVRDLRARRNT
jgi:hypothetical protein